MTDHESPPALEALTRLGFTDLEARAYVFLLGEAPALEISGARAALRFERGPAPLLRSLSFLFKPIFAANHHWAMARGEESLVLELDRRRATTAEEQARVPAAPGPTFAWLTARKS